MKSLGSRRSNALTIAIVACDIGTWSITYSKSKRHPSSPRSSYRLHLVRAVRGTAAAATPVRARIPTAVTIPSTHRFLTRREPARSATTDSTTTKMGVSTTVVPARQTILKHVSPETQRSPESVLAHAAHRLAWPESSLAGAHAKEQAHPKPKRVTASTTTAMARSTRDVDVPWVQPWAATRPPRESLDRAHPEPAFARKAPRRASRMAMELRRLDRAKGPSSEWRKTAAHERTKTVMESSTMVATRSAVLLTSCTEKAEILVMPRSSRESGCAPTLAERGTARSHAPLVGAPRMHLLTVQSEPATAHRHI
jgi:hypothetical protein